MLNIAVSYQKFLIALRKLSLSFGLMERNMFFLKMSLIMAKTSFRDSATCVVLWRDSPGKFNLLGMKIMRVSEVR